MRVVLLLSLALLAAPARSEPLDAFEACMGGDLREAARHPDPIPRQLLRPDPIDPDPARARAETQCVSRQFMRCITSGRSARCVTRLTAWLRAAQSERADRLIPRHAALKARGVRGAHAPALMDRVLNMPNRSYPTGCFEDGLPPQVAAIFGLDPDTLCALVTAERAHVEAGSLERHLDMLEAR